MTTYQGGKSKIGKDLYNVISEVEKLCGVHNLTYFEPFCGMLGVMRHFAENDTRKIEACDLNKNLLDMWVSIQDGWEPPDKVSKKLYDHLKNSKSSPERTFTGYACSFGAQFYTGFADTYDKKKRSTSASRGSKGIEKIRPFIADIKFLSARPYDAFNPKDKLIYCDPPYANTDVRTEFFSNFNSKNFWNTMRKWSKYNIVLISEQSAPSDFVVLWEKKVSNMQRVKFSEKLFIHESLLELLSD